MDIRPTHPKRAAPGVWLALLLPMAVLAASLSACGVTLHSGAQALAYIRGGQLWVANGDGSQPRLLAAGPVASFAWSPSHHQLVYRLASGGGSPAPSVPLTSTFAVPDAPGDLVIISINGGAGIQITPHVAGLARSDAWWDVDGNRLLYREEPAPVDPAALSAAYISSQSDQPVGIARKDVLNAAGIPVLSADGAQVAAIGPQGTIRIGTPGQTGRVVARGALVTLPGTGRPARVLWQPGHDAVLYATGGPSGAVSLVLRDLASGSVRPIVTLPTLLDAAFSPDGSRLLVRTPTAFQLWRVVAKQSPLATWPESDPAALPWWSPDGRELLIQDAAGWRLVHIASGAVTTLLTYRAPATSAMTLPGLWHPAAGGPWRADGAQFVLASPDTAHWRGRSLPQSQGSADGLYTATVASDGSVGAPMLIGSGADRAPSWSYINPSCTFLAFAS